MASYTNNKQQQQRIIQVDIKNTSKESKPCVLKSIQEHSNVKVAKKPMMADIIWVDRALPIKRFYLQRLASNKRVYQRTNRFYGMGERLTKCSLTKSLNILNKYHKSHQITSQQKITSTKKDVVISSSSKTTTTLSDFLPKSFRVPDEVNVIREKTILDEKNDNKKKEWYIVKPDRGRCGRGMFLAPSLKDAIDGWEKEETMDYGDPKFLKPVSKAYVCYIILLIYLSLSLYIYIYIYEN